MQLFVTGLNSGTKALDVSQTDTIYHVMELLEEKTGMPVPRQRLIYSGIQCELERSLKDYKIEKESTIYLLGRLAPEMYVKWQGSWLRAKDSNIFKDFYHDLTRDNVYKYKDSNGYEYETNSLTNLTVYHLKKHVAKFLLLEPYEIDLMSKGQSCEDSVLLSTVSSDFTACLKLVSPYE